MHRLAIEGYMRNYSFLDFITFAYVTHLEIKFTIKKTLGEKKKKMLKLDYSKVLSMKQHKKH